MGFLDDKENQEENKNINGAECERKQGNDEGRHCKNVEPRERLDTFSILMKVMYSLFIYATTVYILWNTGESILLKRANQRCS